ncbi:MAG: capsule assembly Wzi family protein [Ignavibacteria bacterium]
MRIRIFILLIFIVVVTVDGLTQVELVPVSNPVYLFLKKMQVKGVIPDYNSSNIPISREEVANNLKIINRQSKDIDKIDKDMLNDYDIEFGYDLNRGMENTSDLFEKNFNIKRLFDNNKQKYIYSYADSLATMFIDGTGNFSYRQSSGDSLGNNKIILGEIGGRIRGTLFNSLGYYLRISNGAKLFGDQNAINFAAETDPILRGNTKFYYENKNFDTYEGYLRYRTQNNLFAITIGKEALNMGFGYIDKLYLSNNTVPFPFGKVDLKYKAFSYTFVYGSLKGDSLGRDLNWKSIALHRLNIRPSKFINLGLYESVVFTSTPFSWEYLNPFGFLISADMNVGAEKSFENNTFLGLDFELTFIKDLAFQGTIMIDDLDFETIGNNDKTYNTNRFGWQFGGLWVNAFTLPNLSFAVEYTRLDPFMYAHKSNKNSYTNWSMSLGHRLQPNSDEIAIKLGYDITNRIKLSFVYQYQRSGGGFLFDSTGNIKQNYGGDINRGDYWYIEKNRFLQGDRTNRNIFTLSCIIEPIKQYFLEAKFYYRNSSLIYLNKTYNDFYFWITAKIDY